MTNDANHPNTQTAPDTVRTYARPGHNHALRRAAFEAWIETSPTDGSLHTALLAAARQSPYPLQQFALEQLGVLYVADAVPFLEELLEANVDTNLTKISRESLEEIRRIRGNNATVGAGK